jgi:hypothetical protein
MELNTANTTMKNNFQNAKAFTAEVSAVTFQMFSSMIYQHKKAAFVRELVSNAVDSHIEAGIDTPIKVTLPNYGNPYFIVEDFGVGLDEEAFESIYTCYTKSTKRNSNLGIGGFGVGSKSPFAYTNSFQIRIRKNGVEVTFNAFQNENSEPAFAKLHERSTDEPNGVLVKVPVQQRDFQEIADLTAYYLSFFEMKFDVQSDGTFELEYKGIPEDLNERDYALRPLTSRGYGYRSRSNVLIVMGGVPYDYDHNFNSLDSIDRQVLGSQQIFLKFGIGELKVALSRESLSLDENTAQTVTDRLSKIAATLIEHLQEEVDAQESVIAATKFVWQKYGSYGFAFNKFTYKGKKLRPNRTLPKLKSVGLFRGYNNRASAIGKLSLKEIINEGARLSFVYQADEKHTKAIQKYGKMVARENYKSLVFYYRDGVLSPHMVERFKSLFSGLNVEFHTTEELKLKYTDPSLRAKVASGKRTRIGDEKAWGVSWVIKGHAYQYTGREVIDLSDDDVVFLYADDTEFENIPHSYKASLIALSVLLGDEGSKQPIRVIRKNSQNATKLEKNEVQNAREFIRDFSQELNNALAGSACSRHLDNKGQLQDDVLRLMEESNDDMFDDQFQKIKKYAKHQIDDSVFGDFVPFDVFDETKKIVTLAGEFKELKEKAKEKYKILSSYDGYYFNRISKEVYPDLLDFINFQHERLQNQKNAGILDLSLAA